MSDEEGDDGTTYTHKHRTFLQAFMSRQTLTLSDAKPLLSEIENASNPSRPTLPEDITQADLDDYIQLCNAAISPFDFEIRSSYKQTGDKERIYALVNTTSDALTQMATMHSADEIAFVKRVLDAMFETYNTRRAEVMAVTSMQAYKLAKAPGDSGVGRRDSGAQQTQTSQNASITMAQAERVLGSMVDEGWFRRSRNGFYSLTQRAIMELRGWLVEMYNDQQGEEEEEEEGEGGEPHLKVKECAACRDIVTVGQRCPNLPCNARLHERCVQPLFRAQRDQQKCPSCRTNWIDPPPVGEKAAKDADGGGRRSTNGTARGRSSGGPSMRQSDDDAESGAET